jgi:hypothetical protein
MGLTARAGRIVLTIVGVVMLASSGPSCARGDCDDRGCFGQLAVTFDEVPPGVTTAICIDGLCREVPTATVAASTITAFTFEGSRLEGMRVTSSTVVPADAPHGFPFTAGRRSIVVTLGIGERVSRIAVVSYDEDGDEVSEVTTEVEPEVVARGGCGSPCYGVDLRLDAETDSLVESTATSSTRPASGSR